MPKMLLVSEIADLWKNGMNKDTPLVLVTHQIEVGGVGEDSHSVTS
ncbi:hypothetical protein SLEP1_g6115 [Rubroshorea leprosula]|uniref:Uncharacterized protein n=1 Tax=Rubroshorea leprosula TaxID=152421 RepID=A0AAV5HYK5_9ROSI|nr:hypothetical protein SLEP1_g6115 [Rubroshorea leprosula]